VFLSHCLLNENTRYLGGAYRPGVVDEVVGAHVRDGTGICQMPCPEQLVWGGVLKRRMWTLVGRAWLRRALRMLHPALRTYLRLRYRLLARSVAGQITDYRRSGFEVVGVVGVDASPTCGAGLTLDLEASLDALVGCDPDRLDRRLINEAIVDATTAPGRGLFISELDAALSRRRCTVPLFAHDLRSEAPGSLQPTGPHACGVLGATRRRCRSRR
jgi:predicted secreted protein